MEEKAYKWFLQELCKTQLSFKILETGICRGTKVIGWFANSLSDSVISKSVKIVNKTKYLINFFLNERVPILEEYAPEKLICYLYHKNGKKLVTAREAIDLAENQLHGLQVTSIHMAVSSSPVIYSLSAKNVGGELNTEIFFSKFGKYNLQILKDSALVEKIINNLVSISDYIIKINKQELKEIQIDFLFDSTGSLLIIKITRLVLKASDIRSSLLKKSSVKLVKHDSSSDQSFEDEAQNKRPINFIFEKEKKNTTLKVLINKPVVKNTPNFLLMVANTFDRERKKLDKAEPVLLTKTPVPMTPKTPLSAHTINPNFNQFQIQSLKSLRDSKIMKKNITNLNDLLYYLEKTRPRI